MLNRVSHSTDKLVNKLPATNREPLERGQKFGENMIRRTVSCNTNLLNNEHNNDQQQQQINATFDRPGSLTMIVRQGLPLRRKLPWKQQPSAVVKEEFEKEAGICSYMGNSWKDRGNSDQALVYYEKAVSAWKKVANIGCDDMANIHMAGIYSVMEELYKGMGDDDKARESQLLALALLEEDVEEGTDEERDSLLCSQLTHDDDDDCEPSPKRQRSVESTESYK